jgi:hypothetical protein
VVIIFAFLDLGKNISFSDTLLEICKVRPQFLQIVRVGPWNDRLSIIIEKPV